MTGRNTKDILLCKGILIIGLIISFSLFSFEASPIKFYSVNSVYGISIRETNSVCGDNDGFIWAASKTGILRLTNSDYRIYEIPYETADVFIVRLVFANSKLIAYTNNGQIFTYNPVHDRFELIINLGKTLNNQHLSLGNLLVDDSGDFWITSSDGLFRFHPGKLPKIDRILDENYLMNWFDKQSIILAGAEGIWLLDTRSLKRIRIYENKTPPFWIVSALLYDSVRNKLWIGTLSSGLYCYDLNSATISRLPAKSFPRQPILAIEESSNNSMLIGVDGQGIWELDKKGEHVLNVYKENADDPYSLRGNGVYDIFCDGDKRIWVCTVSGGLSYFDQSSPLVNQLVHQINNAGSLINNDVNSLIEDHWGKMWFATNNGISCWNVLSNHWTHFYNNKLEQAQVFLTLCEDDQGRIWAGSYSSGLYVLDGKTGKELAHYTHDENGSPLVSNFIFDIYKDSQGDIWIGGVNGEFICYQSKLNKFRNFSREPISMFAELSSGQIILACSYGLSMLNKETGEVTKFLLGYLVNDLLVLDDDLWICTGGEGLLRYDDKSKKIEKFGSDSGLPSKFINSIEYADGYFWLGTENGLCRFNPNDHSVYTYASVYPLSHTSFNRNAHFKLNNGQLAWGSNNGAIFFDPGLVREIPSKGRIYIQDLMVSGRSIRQIPSFRLDRPVDSIQNVQLRYTQNNLSLELLSLGISSGAKFSWKLEGLEKDWTTPADNRIVSYTNLPSGNFRLRIKLYDSSLGQLITDRSLAVKVIPPFWKRSWFLILLFLFTSGVILLSFLYYIDRLKQKHTEEKVRFFTNTAHDIRTSLTLIKAPVEELSKEGNLSETGRFFLRLALDQARQLSSVVTQLMDFQKVDVGKEQLTLTMTDIVMLISYRRLVFDSFAKSKNIELTFASDRQKYITAVDESKIEKIVDNLISNAVKYSHSQNKVRMELKCDDKKWVLQVKDQGIGISKKAQRQLFKEFYRGDNAANSKIVGSGIGLLLARNYVTMHGGQLSCTSQENVGSTFQVVIPYKEIHNASEVVYPSTDEVVVLPDIMINNGQILKDHKPNRSGEMKVLVVEDNEDLLNFMHTTLSREFNVYTAEDGIKAWDFIIRHLPDLVISDIMMPNMDGFELCRRLKSTYETSHVPIILLTALSERTEQLQGLGLGADDYLTKPFDMLLLEQRIRTIIRNREIVREKALKLIEVNSVEPLLSNEHNDSFMKKMVEVARSNISNSEFDKEDFASSMNVSSSLLYKKIKSFTGQSPTEFIKTIRLNYALDLLHKRKYSITEVSEMCGFTSLGYFSTVFKKHFGESPTDISDRKANS
jgi:signal transduction histidine kinase/DNA-binding response OmpR family regulator/ligand-binding sensor domain-containing protein